MIKACFKNKKCLFIPFIMAGHPDAGTSAQALMALEKSGADMIELGVPFSDPIADGSVNQRAAHQAISNGIHLQNVLDMVFEFRKKGGQTPIILFSYLNPILAMGFEAFCQQAKVSGVNGLLIVDLPPEEGRCFYSHAIKAGLELVLLVSPTTGQKRLAQYKKLKPAFIYYISRLAVTGIQQELSSTLENELQHLRQHLPEINIAVGFGISTVEQARNIAEMADGFVVGSKLVATLESKGIEEFQSLAFDFANI